MLSAKTITMKYGERVVLDDLSLELGAGEQWALLGRSGAGKTTLLLVLAGLLRPTSGTVEQRVGRDEIVYVPQAPSLVPELTARQNAALGLRIRGAPPDVADAVAHQRLRALGLDDADDALPAELSGGMQQRVALARALAIGPRLLLADEPTGALDQVTGAHTTQVLLQYALDSGATLVVATHDRRVAARLPRQLTIQATDRELVQ